MSSGQNFHVHFHLNFGSSESTQGGSSNPFVELGKTLLNSYSQESTPQEQPQETSEPLASLARDLLRSVFSQESTSQQSHESSNSIASVMRNLQSVLGKSPEPAPQETPTPVPQEQPQETSTTTTVTTPEVDSLVTTLMKRLIHFKSMDSDVYRMCSHIYGHLAKSFAPQIFDVDTVIRLVDFYETIPDWVGSQRITELKTEMDVHFKAWKATRTEAHIEEVVTGLRAWYTHLVDYLFVSTELSYDWTNLPKSIASCSSHPNVIQWCRLFVNMIEYIVNADIADLKVTPMVPFTFTGQEEPSTQKNQDLVSSDEEPEIRLLSSESDSSETSDDSSDDSSSGERGVFDTSGLSAVIANLLRNYESD